MNYRVQWLARLDTLEPTLLLPPSRAGGKPLLWDWDQRRGLASCRKAGSPRRGQSRASSVSSPKLIRQATQSFRGEQGVTGRATRQERKSAGLPPHGSIKNGEKEFPDSDKDSAKEKLCLCYLHSYGFLVVMYGCEIWTIKKAECQRIDTFELWCLRHMRVPWTARWSNQPVLKEINPEYSLERLKLQYFGHLMWRVDSLEKTLILERLRARGGGDRGWDGWMASSTKWTWVWARSGKPSTLQFMELQRIGHDWMTEKQHHICITYTLFVYSKWSRSVVSDSLRPHGL